MKKIELRKISHNNSLSEETNAYTAQVWVGGVHVCDVSNHGQGGCDMQHPAKGKTRADVDALNAYIKANYAPENTGMKLKGEDFIMEQDLETICGKLLTEHLIQKDLKRILNRTVAFFDPADRSIRTYKGKNVGPDAERLVAATLQKKPDAIILNKISFDDALKLFKEAA